MVCETSKHGYGRLGSSSKPIPARLRESGWEETAPGAIPPFLSLTPRRVVATVLDVGPAVAEFDAVHRHL